MAAVRVQLPYRPRAWQDACHRELKRFSVLAVHRRAGKTQLALALLVDAALRCKLDRGGFYYLAPQLKQAREVAWRALQAHVEPLRVVGGVDVSQSEETVTFLGNGSRIRLFGADNPDALRGVRADGAVLDEVAQMPPAIWEEILQPALSDRMGWSLFIGTPHGVNLFSQLFFEAASKPDWMARKWTVYETNTIPPEEIERLRLSMSEQAFAREFLCDFAAAGDDQLCSLATVEAAAQRKYQPKDIAEAPLVIGVDPARFGDDRSVIIRRRGLVAFPPQVVHGVDNMDLAARVAAEIEEHHPDAVFIDAGAGSGVIDRLRQLNYQVTEVPFGGKAVAANRFVNRRSEMWWSMREWLASGAIPNDVVLKQELATPTYKLDASGKVVLESKDDIKKRLPSSGSPDIADALALTFAHPVQRRTELQRLQSRFAGRKGRDHDPYSRSP